MTKLTDDDPRVVAGLKVLLARVNQFAGEELNSLVLDAIQETISNFRTSFRLQHGVNFPEMVIFYLPSVPFLILYRRDLDEEQVRIKMHDLIRHLQRVRKLPAAIEIAAAIRRCWPGYDPPVESLRRDPKILRPVH